MYMHIFVLQIKIFCKWKLESCSKYIYTQGSQIF